MTRIDLHTHSARSDGTDTPAELVRRAADAGRSTSHSQRPWASPAKTERSKCESASLVSTYHSEMGWPEIRTFACGGPSPISAPGSVRSTFAQRAPSPTPGSSETTVSSTTPSGSLGPEQVMKQARPSRPGATTQPKSVTAHPGVNGQGTNVGIPADRLMCSANVP